MKNQLRFDKYDRQYVRYAAKIEGLSAKALLKKWADEYTARHVSLKKVQPFRHFAMMELTSIIANFEERKRLRKSLPFRKSEAALNRAYENMLANAAAL